MLISYNIDDTRRRAAENTIVDLIKVLILNSTLTQLHSYESGAYQSFDLLFRWAGPFNCPFYTFFLFRTYAFKCACNFWVRYYYAAEPEKCSQSYLANRMLMLEIVIIYCFSGLKVNHLEARIYIFRVVPTSFSSHCSRSGRQEADDGWISIRNDCKIIFSPFFLFFCYI